MSMSDILFQAIDDIEEGEEHLRPEVDPELLNELTALKVAIAALAHRFVALPVALTPQEFAKAALVAAGLRVVPPDGTEN